MQHFIEEGEVDAREEGTAGEEASVHGSGSGRVVGSLGTRGVVEDDRPGDGRTGVGVQKPREAIGDKLETRRRTFPTANQTKIVAILEYPDSELRRTQ
jgi:hypothetical protein